MTPRVFVIGTNTEIGKTTVTAALLRAAQHSTLRPVPFKPAQSGDAGGESDAQQLLSAAGLPGTALDLICPLRYTAPVAPGIAQNAAPFLVSADSPHRVLQHPSLSTSPASATPLPEPLRQAKAALRRCEELFQPDLIFVEGAGGLHVPMPGGTWQSQWVVALATHTLVIGNTGLGTINHTLLTLDAVHRLPLPNLGFILNASAPENPVSDPSIPDNAAVIAAASGSPYLGSVAFDPTDRPNVDHVWARLRSLLQPG